jgi:hypothetical protein
MEYLKYNAMCLGNLVADAVPDRERYIYKEDL